MTIPRDVMHSGLRALLSGGACWESGTPDTIQSDPTKDNFGLSPRAYALRILRMASYINPNTKSLVDRALKSRAAGSSDRYCLFVDASAIGPQMRIMPLGAEHVGMDLDTPHIVAARVSFLRKILISHAVIDPTQQTTPAMLRLAWWGYLNDCIDLAFDKDEAGKTRLFPEFWTTLFSFYPEPNIVVIAKIDSMFGAIATIDPAIVGDLSDKVPVTDSW